MNKKINFIINKLSYSGYIQEDIKNMTIDIIKDLLKQLEAYENAVGKVIGLIYDYQMNDKDNSNYKEMLYFLKNIGSDK